MRENIIIRMLRHKLNVWSWEKKIQTSTDRIAKVLGIPKGSYKYNILKNDVANGVISEEDILYKK
ncbi:MAG: hypothetical protein ABS939_00705 [Psychrobacillus sp.]